MSTLEVNKITPVSGGTTVQIGESGDTINIPAGATIANAGTATGFGVSLANGADNRVVTASSASALNGEANLTFDGSTMALNKSGSNGGGLVTSITTEVGNTESTGDGTSIAFDGELSNSTWRFGRVGGVNSGSNYGVTLVFHTNAGNGSGASTTTTERMNIDSSGRVNINTASAITPEGVLQVSGNSSQNLSAWRVATNGNVGLRFFNSSTQGVGGITINGASTVYATSSDYRLKENEVAISDGIERLKQLKPYKFNFKTEPDTIVDGFFAHEVSSVVPEAVSGEKDATETYTDDNGDEQTRINEQGIDQSKLVPLLTSALQEAITKIETLETENTDIKARLAALESA